MRAAVRQLPHCSSRRHQRPRGNHQQCRSPHLLPPFVFISSWCIQGARNSCSPLVTAVSMQQLPLLLLLKLILLEVCFGGVLGDSVAHCSRSQRRGCREMPQYRSTPSLSSKFLFEPLHCSQLIIVNHNLPVPSPPVPNKRQNSNCRSKSPTAVSASVTQSSLTRHHHHFILLRLAFPRVRHPSHGTDLARACCCPPPSFQHSSAPPKNNSSSSPSSITPFVRLPIGLVLPSSSLRSSSVHCSSRGAPFSQKERGRGGPAASFRSQIFVFFF